MKAMSTPECALVVDDDPILLEVATSLLRKRGLREVVRATNGAEALEALNRRRDCVGLILCDLQMPEMDGIAFMRSLAALSYSGPIVIVSSMSDQVRSLASQVGKSHGLNILGTVKKPLSPAKLNVILDEGGEVTARPAVQVREEISEAALREALATGAIVAHYQPKLDMATGQIVGAEALARWELPDGSLISPDRFVPLAERTGLIAAIDHCIMHRASADLVHLQTLHPSFCVSVNAGADTLDDVKVHDMLVGMLAARGLRHSHFTLEITESQALRKTTSLMEVLGRLRLSGFALSIDDFGTGHSNLETLREFPFTEIKIDRSFVQEALSSASASASVEACLLLGREMGMTIVAEGVETKEHWQFLLSKGTTAAQGYFIAKPMSLRDMRSWMQQRAAMPAARAR